MVHNDMLWNLPSPADHFRPCPPPPHVLRVPSLTPALEAPFQYPAGHPPSRDAANKRPREPFVASKGLLKLAAPIPAGQRLMTYLFDAMPAHTQYPKMTNNDGKADCLICFRSAFPSPHNSCQLESCIALKRRQRDNQRLHIDLAVEPWRSKPEAYWQPVVAWLRLPGVDALIRPTAAFKKLTPSANWT
jgi:hypothetical protein